MAEHKWVHCSAGQPIPETAVPGGRDVDGTEIFVGRAFHEGDMIPAKVIPEKNVAYVSWNGGEHPKYEFEVLCRGEFSWEFCSNGAVPDQAIAAGHACNGEPLYVGRFIHEGAQTIGKVHPSHGCLYMPYDGKEIAFKDYEVLVLN